jgi:hypothetical protein
VIIANSLIITPHSIVYTVRRAEFIKFFQQVLTEYVYIMVYNIKNKMTGRIRQPIWWFLATPVSPGMMPTAVATIRTRMPSGPEK